jgi:cyclopropane fatty-acyl-phospholipid synthase-like methyltransferase
VMHFAGKGNKGAFQKTIEVTRKGYGVQIFMASLEKPVELFLGPVMAAYVLNTYANLPCMWTILLALAYPLYLGGIIVAVFVQSQTYGEHSQGLETVEVNKKEFLTFNDKAFEKEYSGQKIPIETAIEAFQDGKIDFKLKGNKDLTVLETMRRRYSIFKFSFTRDHLRSIFQDLLKRVWKHDSNADKADVSDVYNRGNDFYGWFLCEKMLYSVGIWESSDDAQFEDKKTMAAAINKAQDRKLDKICGELAMMRPGMEHLDLGCGWGALVLHATGKYKVHSTGITLSQEQANFIASKTPKDNKNIDIKVLNAWDWLAQKVEEGVKYDVITCLEMSEHIGVRDYQKFCHAVRSVLKDDGIFYLQIAGLRRNWQYEDLIWGMFMNRYVFPGADASCPLYWDVEQLERSGFEIRSIENNGVHYGLTIRAWYHNWVWNKDVVVAKYGEKAWRNWSIFLSWSYLIAMQGSSTVYMIAMTKNFPCDARSRAPLSKPKSGQTSLEVATSDFGIDRAKLWIDGMRTGWEKPKWEK